MRRAMIPAIVPAAGRSERMGRPKLTLPIDGISVIARVVAALREGGADPVVVVVPPAAMPGAAELAVEAEQAGACVVVADPAPPDMRASVQCGLDRLGKMPGHRSTLLIAPGDSPGISAGLVARVIARARVEPRSIIIPTSQGRRGHPIALPSSLADEIRELPADVGINTMVRRHADKVVELDLDDPDAIADLDTPEDYERWAGPGSDPSRRIERSGRSGACG
jgi:molybdenum cofactor cytidylyltransferase